MSAVAAYGSLAPCQPIFECLDGMYNTKLMYVGVDLGIHDALAGGVTMTAQQLADKLHLKADRLERFLRTLVFLNLIEEHENGFRNSPSSEMYLVSSSPRCFLGYLTLSEHTAKTFSEGLINTLKGQGRLDKRQTQDNNNTFTYDNNMYDQKYEAKIFGEGMQAIGRSDMDCIKYVDFTGIKTVVDLGGNLGWQAREIRRFHPSVENVIVAELERVTQIGSQIPENQNARIEFRTVDFLTDELPQADAYILGHVIHCYSAAQCKELLKKIHKALTPGGLLVLLESVLQPKKTAPGWALILDIIMLVDLAGCERSADEYKALLASEGFTDFSCHFVEGGTFFDVITARKA